MPFLIGYLLKLSICLGAVYLFYQGVLRRLTFYYWNRYFLVGYTLLAFVIPFVNITPTLEKNELENNTIVRFIPPVVEAGNRGGSPVHETGLAAWNKWDWALLVLIVGVMVLSLVFIIRFISFLKMRHKARLISDEGVKLYQVDRNIIPFSFGNAVFINQQLHTGDELKEIIRHEFVHIKQKHTVDIIWCEILCILNWYNPFAWLIRKAVRQNLEFIADDKVLQNGLSKKHYQYLLLKVIGNNHFSIANQFNFSSLKKRITMMNKMRSARMHLFKFLFILPLLALLLLAFRNEKRSRQQATGQRYTRVVNPIDTIPGESWSYFIDPSNNDPIDLVTTKGHRVHIRTENGERVVIVDDRNTKKSLRVPLAKWSADLDHYISLYGNPAPPKAPPPPPPPPPAVLPKDVESMVFKGKSTTVILKNGQKETYDVDSEKDKEVFEKKYGLPLPPPLPPVPPVLVAPTTPPAPPAPPSKVSVSGESGGEGVSIATDEINVVTSVKPTIAVTTKLAPLSTVAVAGPAKISISPSAAVTALSPVQATSSVHVGVTAPVPPGEPVVFDGETIFEAKIGKSLSKEKLDKIIQAAKEKGVELEFDEVNYDSKNQITHLSGTMKKENSKSTFSFSGFETLTLLVIGKNGKYSCLTYFNNAKEVI